MFIIFAVSAVAVADMFLKKAGTIGSFQAALVNPWMLGVIVLYLFQIVAFAYLFASGEKLIYIGIMQTVLYALIVILGGVFFFGETLSPIHIAGIVLAIAGVLLLNS